MRSASCSARAPLPDAIVRVPPARWRDGFEHAVVDELLEVLGEAKRYRAASDEQAQLHVRPDRAAGEVGAGHQGGVVVGTRTVGGSDPSGEIDTTPPRHRPNRWHTVGRRRDRTARPSGPTALARTARAALRRRQPACHALDSVVERTRVRRLPATLAAVLVAVAGVAGCGSPSEDPGAGAPSAAAQTSGSPAPPTTMAAKKPLSAAQAKARYLAIVKPYNVALERLEQGFNSGEPIGELRPLADRVARSNATQIRQLRAALWPADVRAAIRDLVAECEAAQRYWRQAAQAGTRDELAKVVVAAARHDGSEAAGKIRKALGLPGYDEGDYSSSNP